MCALVETRDLERAARACGGLLEDQADLLSLQVFLLGTRILCALQIAREIEQVAELPWRVVLNGQQRSVAKIEAHGVLFLNGVASDRTRHAVSAAAPATEFCAAHRDHLDPGLAEQRVGVRVA